MFQKAGTSIQTHVSEQETLCRVFFRLSANFLGLSGGYQVVAAQV